MKRRWVTADFGGDERTFQLRLGEIRQLEEKHGTLLELAQAIGAGKQKLWDVRETIRLGLIGGGMEAEAALALVKAEVDEAPAGEHALLAHAVLLGAYAGFDDEKKSPAMNRKARRKTASTSR